MKKRRRKLSIKLLLMVGFFALTIVIFSTAFTSIWFWFDQTFLMTVEVSSYLYEANDFIDATRVPAYYETGEKDEYYEEIEHYLSSHMQHSRLKYFYVFVPEDDEIVFIWDAANEDNSVDLGFREAYENEDEKQRIFDIYKENPSLALTYSEDETYGHLASSYYPLLDPNGKPVAVIGADVDADSLFSSLKNIFYVNVCVIGIVTLIALLIYNAAIARNVLRPIRLLHKATKEVVTSIDDRNSEPFKVDIHTNDELEDLADAFTQMDEDLKKHVSELEAVTAEKEKIKAELNVAARIQNEMLPSIFPPFPDRKEFDLYASMDPAREVGGDFYDFFMIDPDHLGVVIADVSDKGIPAALFMVISKTLLKTRAMAGGTPEEILFDVNNQLCEGNDSSLFVTVWFAILNIRTGEGVAANAGHENPTLRRKGQPFEMISYHHDTPLGLMPNMKFIDRNFKINPGDTIFVYTDGAVEAMNHDNEQFTPARLVDTLNTVPEDDPKKMITTVTEAIAAFVQDAPQFDDTTMLALCYFGEEGRKEDA